MLFAASAPSTVSQMLLCLRRRVSRLECVASEQARHINTPGSARVTKRVRNTAECYGKQLFDHALSESFAVCMGRLRLGSRQSLTCQAKPSIASTLQRIHVSRLQSVQVSVGGGQVSVFLDCPQRADFNLPWRGMRPHTCALLELMSHPIISEGLRTQVTDGVEHAPDVMQPEEWDMHVYRFRPLHHLML
jgi:hypothetical protein